MQNVSTFWTTILDGVVIKGFHPQLVFSFLDLIRHLRVGRGLFFKTILGCTPLHLHHFTKVSFKSLQESATFKTINSATRIFYLLWFINLKLCFIHNSHPLNIIKMFHMLWKREKTKQNQVFFLYTILMWIIVPTDWLLWIS